VRTLSTRNLDPSTSIEH